MKNSNIDPRFASEALLLALSSRKNSKSKDRIRSWLRSHGFLVERFQESGLMRFMEKCPLSPNRKSLTIHNVKPNGMEITLVLKDEGGTLCFKLEKIEKGFLIKHSSEKGWVFDNRGRLVERVEHKKSKIWLENNCLDAKGENVCDLVKFISTCPLCKSTKPLRFHRSNDETLDLQCGCINYFRIRKESDRYIITRRSEVLAAFDLKGKHIVNAAGEKLKRKTRKTE